MRNTWPVTGAETCHLQKLLPKISDLNSNRRVTKSIYRSSSIFAHFLLLFPLESTFNHDTADQQWHMNPLTAAMKQTGAHLRVTSIWHNKCLCKLDNVLPLLHRWMPDPVLLIHLSSVVRSSLNESFRALRATAFLISSRKVADTNMTDAFMHCDNAGIFLSEFKLLDDADGQMNCFRSLSSKQLRINIWFCLNAKKFAFTGPDKVLAV